ncbi:hypothetical protein NUW58_g1728 [Xylaria curta]|uniref:Uncharacterized protein n=1 Tax=Xylaria curta TaxID=42375 RepID=A0ACC1PJ06_9PEZI|nr:hypothetical protein NUW58_g1728 [Xylaria curta]
MDALSALSIAGTVTQFVSFAGNLVSQASELHESANNATAEVQNIDNVYSTLLEFSFGLKNANRDLSELEHNLEAGRLLVLVVECQCDCGKLLDITRALKSGSEHKTWYRCMRKAIESAWKLPEIRLLDERLQRTQLTLVLLISSISSQFQHVQEQRIVRLQKDGGLHHLNQDRQFAELRQILQSIQSQIAKLENVDFSRTIQKTWYPNHVTELEKQMQSLCVNANDIQKQQAILDTLSFDSRAIRHEAIPEAHSGTFQWAFATDELEEEEKKDKMKLLHWLQHGEGIFWVTGRPGSGKSTFMKHIADNPNTRAALRQWSSSCEPVISSHYFWIFGTPMQKSKEGLLRTLLFEIFRQYPVLLKDVCPERWDSEFSSSAGAKPWSAAELRHVLHLLVAPEIDIKICFFIDGLDEYNGDHLEVSEELLRLSKLRNIKCCISSRPWNVFHDAFGYDKSQHLCLHNLTKRDIRHYVHDRLTPHPRWQRLVDQAVYDTHLIEYIAEKSHGVFLWVALVTDRLRNGLTNDDDLSDLSSRLAGFPSDLESFFDHILQTVEPFYHEKMAGTLRLARAADKPLSTLFYEFHDIEYRDDEYFLNIKRPQPNRGQESVGDRVQRRLNAYCKGLLEVHDDRVEFLHRTVADYLSIPDVAERLSMQSPTWFHPELSLAKVHLACIKILPLTVPHRYHPGSYDSNLLDNHLRGVLTLASSYDRDNSTIRDKFRRLLYEIESSLNAESCTAPAPCISTGTFTAFYFRERLLQSRLPKYLGKMLSVNAKYLDNLDWPPLAIVMEEGNPSQHVETIRLLLENGQNPNEELKIRVSNEIERVKTPWTVLLSLIVRQTRDGLASRLLPDFGLCLRLGILDLFIRYNADPNASVYRREGQHHTTAWIDILFACFDIKGCDEERYLRILGQLLRNASVDGVTPMGTESAMSVESASETILKRFFYLARVLGYSPDFEFSSDFIVQISESLVRRACHAHWSLETVWPEVEQAFGDAKTKHLKKIYQAECKFREKDSIFKRLIRGGKSMPLFNGGKRELGHASQKKSPEGKLSLDEIWAEAAKAFESICDQSLKKGEVKSFDDVQKKIESSAKASYGLDADQEDKWDRAKSVGLTSLKYLKMLVGAASQASEFLPLPSVVASVTSLALFFVFDIPVAIKGYNDAVNEVFSEVSSALSQFQIYQSMANVDERLIHKIHLVMVNFVKLCAHVIQYRQGRKRDRYFRFRRLLLTIDIEVLRQFKSVFEDDSGLAAQMAEFKKALQQQRDVEGTITLATVVETRQDIALMLNRFIIFEKTTEETGRAVQSLYAEADRVKSLKKVRDSLGVPATVRLDGKTTQTCTDIYRKCTHSTGSWLWEHNSYTTWTTPKDKDSPHVLVISGPASSGRTAASSLITKRLEEQKGRIYVAHYFFAASTQKADDLEKNIVQSALKYMAFQIARVDNTVQKALSKACEADPGLFRNLTELNAIWRELKIGTPGSGASYYLVFDGLDNLPPKESEMLLDFMFGSTLMETSGGSVRILATGQDELFGNKLAMSTSLRIRMEEHNTTDMRIIIEEKLNKQGILANAKPNSHQQQAKDKILEKLPYKVKGSYSSLQFELDEFIRLLSTRATVKELDEMLDQTTSSHEIAIKKLQRSLAPDEISELNELLKWVLFSLVPVDLEMLESAMFLFSGTESLAPLQYIIKNKYHTVLKLDGTTVSGHDGMREYFQKVNDELNQPSRSRDRATISMSITINNGKSWFLLIAFSSERTVNFHQILFTKRNSFNPCRSVDQELCGHFLWDLAHKAIRDKFKFDFDATSNALRSGRGTISVVEFDAHRTILTRAFEYLNQEPRDETAVIGRYLCSWLPYQLFRLRELQDEDKGELMPDEQLEIGKNLYELFKPEGLFLRHKNAFEQVWWSSDEIEDVQKWLMDSAVVRKLNKTWREEVQSAVSPMQGFMKPFAKSVVTGFLRERTRDLQNAWDWIEEFAGVDVRKNRFPADLRVDVSDKTVSVWERFSSWCQGFLELSDSQLDSLWYERLAECASFLEHDDAAVTYLYKRALEKENPSWLCHRGYGETHFKHGRISEAIEQVGLALNEAGREGVNPKPEKKDIAGLHLLLGEYNYAAGERQKAAEHYAIASQSDDAEQAKRGKVGHLKSNLHLPDAEDIRVFLRKIMTQTDGEGNLVENLLKTIARDEDHDAIITKMLSAAKDDSELLKSLMQFMETATGPALSRNENNGAPSDDRFREMETRGVLLLMRGNAVYRYQQAPGGIEPVDEALRLWQEARDQLTDVGGNNASIARRNATSALAKHYFQSMMDAKHLAYVDELSRLADSETDTHLSDSPGFMGILYALHGKKELSRSVLKSRVRLALHLLSDDLPENDSWAYLMMFRVLAQYGDFLNAGVAMSLSGMPDRVTEVLDIDSEAKDIDDSEETDREKVLGFAIKLAKETIRIAKTEIPDASQQSRRVEVALAHINSLMSVVKTGAESEAKSDVVAEKFANGDAPEQPVSDPNEAKARDLIRARLSSIGSAQVSDQTWYCDGRTLDGNQCPNVVGSQKAFYHCIYCSGRDFCRDCLAQLRDPKPGVEITVCSPKHRWFRIPPQGVEGVVGTRAKTVKVPKEVRALAEDEAIIEAIWAEDGSAREILVETWKETIAKEWEIPLEEIRNSAAGQAPYAGE